MPNYQYKVVQWDKFDSIEVDDLIRQEIANGWDYYDTAHVHESRLVIIFRKQAQA